MVKLQVYVDNNCWSCAESRRIVAEFAPQFPQVEIELLDIRSNLTPEIVFAAPTYVLNGHIISLGNPYRAALRQALQAALAESNA